MKRKLRNPKRKGISFEREVRKYLEEAGYFVVRQAASSFPDLIAVAQTGRIYAYECKVNGKISSKEKKKLIELYERYKIVPVVAYKKEKQIWLKWVLDPVKYGP